jgi:hypothetical protein
MRGWWANFCLQNSGVSNDSPGNISVGICFNYVSDVVTQPIVVTRNNEHCEVHFSERWAGFFQPVQLIGPLSLTEASSSARRDI